MSLSASEITNRAKSIDFILRSVISGILALVLVGAVVACVLLKIPLSGSAGEILNVAVGMVIGFFFANNASINGSMLRSLPGGRSTDATISDACQDTTESK